MPKIRELEVESAFKFRRVLHDFEHGPQIKVSHTYCVSVDTKKFYRVDHSNYDVNYSRVVDEIGLDVGPVLDPIYTEKCSGIRWFFDVLVTEVGIPRFGEGKIERDVFSRGIDLDFSVNPKGTGYYRSMISMTQRSTISLNIKDFGSLNLAPSQINPDYLGQLIDMIHYHFSTRGEYTVPM